MVARSLAQHVLHVQNGPVRLEQFAELDAAEPQLELEDLLTERRLQPAFEQARQVLVAALLRVESIERMQRALVQWIDLEDAFVVAGRLGRLLGDLLADQGHLGQHGRPPTGVEGGLGSPIVERFELAPPFGAGEDVLEPGEGTLVGGIEEEDLLQIGSRTHRIAESLLVPAGGTVAQLDLDVGRQLAQQHLAEDLGQVRGPAGAHGQGLGARPQLELERILRGRAQDHVQGGAVALELVLEHVGEAAVEGETLGLGGGMFQENAQRVRLPARVAMGGILLGQHCCRSGLHVRAPLEALEDSNDAWVVGNQLERAHRGAESLGWPLETVQMELGELHFPFGPFGTREPVAVPSDHLGCALRVTSAEQQSRQSAQSDLVRRSQLEHSTVEQNSLLSGLEHFVVQRGPLAEDRDRSSSLGA